MTRLVKKLKYPQYVSKQAVTSAYESEEDGEYYEIPSIAAPSQYGSSSGNDIFLGPESTTLTSEVQMPDISIPIDIDHVNAYGTVALAAVSAGAAASAAGPGSPVSVPSASFAAAMGALVPSCTGSNCHLSGQ